MSIEAIVTSLATTALAGSVAIVAVLALRTPMRRVFGAGIAYALWIAVPLALLATLVPGGWRPPLPATFAVAMPSVQVGAPHVVADASAAAASLAMGAGAAWLLALWALGMMTMAALLWRQQYRYRRSLGRLQPSEPGVSIAQHALHGPLVLGAWRPQVVLPVDFAQRYPPQQAQLVLAHERMHIARGDTRCNLLLAALRCVYWFNPLLHWAATRFRVDQELACDAAVLARHPSSRRSYAEAMLQTQLDAVALPVGCHWQASALLRQRIVLLQRPVVRGWRRGVGIAVVAMAALGGSVAALVFPASVPANAMARDVVPSGVVKDTLDQPAPRGASRPGTATAGASARIPTSRFMPPPHYPNAAIRAGISGKLVLLLKVDAVGKVRAVRVLDHGSGSPALDAAAVAAAWQWRFNPAMAHGRAVAAMLKVPVAFEVGMDPVSPPAGVADAGRYRWYRLGEEAGKGVADLCDKLTPDTRGRTALPLCGMTTAVR
ncbi:TonB family protein [Xanthomonas albilineans]|uniref:TonB family protein n=1 Tax=Xanthomonas albilineans TaxID=29447 RepID=UPI0005F30065|nr:TonB family protein [Xanthomonas albilineans]